MKTTAPIYAAVLLLAACGGQSPAENSAQALEDAAEQSTPEAANVLMNAADEIRDQNLQAPVSQPGSPAQKAMEAAGRAQAAAPPTAAAPARPVPAPPAQGAKPHAKGDPVPPPKIKAGQEDHSGHNNMQ